LPKSPILKGFSPANAVVALQEVQTRQKIGVLTAKPTALPAGTKLRETP